MFNFQNGFNCSQCGRVIDIGEPFLASATFPARSFSEEDIISTHFFATQGEVLCRRCAVDRLGTATLAKLNGTVFDDIEIESKKRSAR